MAGGDRQVSRRAATPINQLKLKVRTGTPGRFPPTLVCIPTNDVTSSLQGIARNSSCANFSGLRPRATRVLKQSPGLFQSEPERGFSPAPSAQNGKAPLGGAFLFWRRGRDKSEICQKPLPINDLVIAGVKNSLPVLLLVAACIAYSTHTLRLIKIVNCKLDVLGEIEF